jgi:parvulin-like peptidyl-prolyl isomerase
MFGLFVSIAVVLVACSGADVAARVGDLEITHAQVRERADLFRFLGGLNQQPCGTPAGGETAGAACARFALGNLVQSGVMDGYVQRKGIELGPRAVADALAGLDASLGQGELDRQLKDAGLTRADVVELASDSLLVQEVAGAIAEERVGEDALLSEYESRPLEFTTVEVQHILVGSETEAIDAYRQVTAPGATEETFAALARRISTDTESAENGGGYPATPASQYVSEFAEVAVGLEPGEIGRPVQTQFGWHVIRLVDEQVIPFAQVREQLLQELSGTTFQDWFRQRARALEIEVNPRYGRFDQRTLQVEAVRSSDPDAASATPTGAATQQP